jgi:hypothetical protein
MNKLCIKRTFGVLQIISAVMIRNLQTIGYWKSILAEILHKGKITKLRNYQFARSSGPAMKRKTLEETRCLEVIVRCCEKLYWKMLRVGSSNFNPLMYYHALRSKIFAQEINFETYEHIKLCVLYA